MPTAFDQSTYQVRLDWGLPGLERLASSDVVVVVDVLHFSTRLADAVETGTEAGLSAEEVHEASAVAAAAASRGATVLVGGIRNAAAVARAVQQIQERRQARTSVAVIAVGQTDAAAGVRFAVEDQLGAGAVVAALTERGIDHTAPEAAVAAEGFHALRRALGHLVSASGSGRDSADAEAAARAAQLDAVDAVPLLRDGRFVAFA
ncbi:2-phosphosulfolactate phosphatase [Microbacterium sp. 179-I 3D4 NHS]|uniref:2-phosphosulfolactate phosphatase n=1 Tax=Microbacterium sp. 179-I 3D4 NHS TaxID=3142381 RepID=UPI0039A23933